MPKVALDQGAYEARGIIANAQVCINLYAEPNTKDAPFPVTHYPAPGLSLWKDYSAHGSQVRGLYVTSTRDVVAVIGQTMVNAGTGDVMGTLPTLSNIPVSMCDNGTTLVAVDGTEWGGTAPLSALGPGSLTTITDSNFLGSTRVDFIDTFLVFNQPYTRNFYTTTSNVVTPFDPLYFAAKVGWNDILVCACVLHDNIWLLGEATTEIWYNAGAAAFPFARMPNSILQQGCSAPYSPVITATALYWISQDRWGRYMCMRGEGYGAKRVSNYAIENIWNNYPTVGDAVGMSYQIGGHETVGWFFNAGNAWWAYDVSTQMWHQRTFNGVSNAWLPYCAGFSRSIPPAAETPGTLVGDRQSGRIYFLLQSNYTDNGTPITRQRSWSHLQADDGQRVAHTRFAAAFAGGAMVPNTLDLDWSDDAGYTFGTPVTQTYEFTSGQYQWRRLGYARDRVYRLTWTGNGECALNGAYVDITPHGT